VAAPSSATGTLSTSTPPSTNLLAAAPIIYYVSTSGSDANDGLSTNTPFASLAKAGAAATHPGDVIALKRGDTWSSGTAVQISHGGSSGAPIVWDGGLWGSGANAVIQSNANRGPMNMAVVNIIGTSYVTFQNITIDGNNTATFGLVIGGTDNYESYPSRQNAESYITVQDSTIKNCGNGSDQRIALMVRTWNNDMSNITLQRLVIDGSDDEGVAFYPGKSQDGATPAQISNSYLGYSTITNYGRRNSPQGEGLLINNKTMGLVVEHNTIIQGPYGHGPSVAFAANESNTAYYPTGTIVRYNDLRVRDKWAVSIFIGRPITADLYYNKISSATTATDSSGGGVVIWNADYTGAALRFFNNTIYTTGGMGFYSQMTAGADTFINNIVYNTGTNLCLAADRAGLMIHSNNALFRSAGSAMTVVYESGSFDRSTLNTWEPTAVAADPAMTNPGAYDFTLTSGSPAIDAGASLGLSPDFAGTSVPQGRSPDIGAYEWK